MDNDHYWRRCLPRTGDFKLITDTGRGRASDSFICVCEPDDESCHCDEFQHELIQDVDFVVSRSVLSRNSSYWSDYFKRAAQSEDPDEVKECVLEIEAETLGTLLCGMYETKSRKCDHHPSFRNLVDALKLANRWGMPKARHSLVFRAISLISPMSMDIVAFGPRPDITDLFVAAMAEGQTVVRILYNALVSYYVLDHLRPLEIVHIDFTSAHQKQLGERSVRRLFSMTTYLIDLGVLREMHIDDPPTVFERVSEEEKQKRARIREVLDLPMRLLIFPAFD